MPSHKNHEHLEKIKDAVVNTDKLSEEEKSETLKRIEEWIAEDKAFGTLKNELLEMGIFFETLLAELGLE